MVSSITKNSPQTKIGELGADLAYIGFSIKQHLQDIYNNDPDRFIDTLSSIKMLTKNFGLSLKQIGIELNHKISFVRK